MKRFLVTFAFTSILAACGGENRENQQELASDEPHNTPVQNDNGSEAGGLASSETQEVTPLVTPSPEITLSPPTASPTGEPAIINTPIVSASPVNTPTTTPVVMATATPAVMPMASPAPVANVGSMMPENYHDSPEEPTAVGREGVFYFSYDDSSSTAPRDLSIFNIENGVKPSESWGRPFEFLNAETFEHFNAEDYGPFEISMGIMDLGANALPLNEELVEIIEEVGASRLYGLGVNISGPTLSHDERPNVVLTLVVDVSGSMISPYASETRSDISSLLDVTKHALTALMESLKEGDEVNLVSFNHEANIVFESDLFDESDFLAAVNGLVSNGSTNLNAGIELAYEVANRNFNPEKANRVVMLTDAYANVGETSTSIIAENTTINNQEGIYFAGVGVGSGFNEAFLNELTDMGKSVYSAMVTPEDGERIFTTGFMRFIDAAVRDVKFKLTYPNNAVHIFSAAEEVSTISSEVSETHFSYNDSQFFFELFAVDEKTTKDFKLFKLEVMYEDDEGVEYSEEVSKLDVDLIGQGSNQIRQAALVVTLARLVAGHIDCSSVLGSWIYSIEIFDEKSEEYITLIDQYCSINPEPYPETDYLAE